MKLYISPTSPFARKARIVVLEKGLSDEVEELVIQTNAIDPNAELMQVNPLAKIPCLVLEDGQAIFDSRVICNYLDREHGSGAVLHATGNVRHKTLIALADGAMDAAVLVMYEVLLREEAKRSQEIAEAQWLKVTRALASIENDYKDILERINMGAIGVVCLLEYLDFRFADRDWRAIVPDLAIWYEGVKDRPSVKATRPQ